MFVNPPSGIYRENFQYGLGSLSVLQVTINEVMSYECPSIWMWIWDRPVRPPLFNNSLNSVWAFKPLTEFLTE